MTIDTFYPRDQRLKDCIEYYYFLKADSPEFEAEYYALPNTLQALNIHKDIACEIDSHSVQVTGIQENNYVMILQGSFELPLHVQLKARMDKVTVIFKPLGLNHFIKSVFIEIASRPTQMYCKWLQGLLQANGSDHDDVKKPRRFQVGTGGLQAPVSGSFDCY